MPEPIGSASTACTSGLRSLRPSDTPARVPPVPIALTNAWTLPPVCSQISGAVDSRCARRLAGLSNWLAQTTPCGVVAASSLGKASRIPDVVARIRVRHGRNQAERGADRAKRALLLLALRLRHHDHGAVAKRTPDHGEADAGVSGGALDDRAPRLEDAPRLGIADDPEGGAVLDRLPGIQEFGLAENLAAGGVRETPQADQRGVADEIDNVGCDRARRHIQPPAGGPPPPGRRRSIPRCGS